MKLLGGVVASARISPCGAYRYELGRRWGPGPQVAWVMLNPSTASADLDDRTIRKCQHFARTWGYDGIVVANLFALRSTDPKVLKSDPSPVGPLNDVTLRWLFRSGEVGLTVAAWGVGGRIRQRGAAVLGMADREGRTVHALKVSKDGYPWHPLYVRGDVEPVVYRRVP